MKDQYIEKKKKILFVINNLSVGGAETILVDTVNALCNEYDITVHTVTDKGPFRERLSKNVRYKSIVRAKTNFFTKLFAYIISFIASPEFTYKKFIKDDYDYEIAFLEGVPTKLVSGSDNEKAKKYAWVHIDLNETFGLEKVHPSMEAHIECYKKFDKIVCVSKTVKDAFTKRFGITDNLIVKYNLLDDKDVLARSKDPVERTERTRIVSVGRLVRRKGFDRLLYIIRQFKKEEIDCELVIVGDGSRREELEGYATYHNISDMVTFIGYSDNPYKYINSADLVVLPSRAEGYSTVATESVIIGKPTIVCDCSGMSEIFGNSEYGVVVPNNEEDLYEAVKQMVTDNEHREYYRLKACERAKDFTKEKRIEELTELFA